MLFSRPPPRLCRRLVSQYQHLASSRRQLTSLTIPFNPATSTKVPPPPLPPPTAFPQLTSTQSQISSLLTTALTASPPPTHHNAAVLLTSTSLAPWLQDASFLASLLASLRPASSDITLLAAAVDTIPHLSPTGTGTYTTTQGLSFLLGPRATLFTPTPTDQNPAASLEFHLPPLSPTSRPLLVTLPAALTVFANGRPHTVLTSRWDTSSTTSSPRLVDVAAASHAVIRPDALAAGQSRITLPLVPVTPARRIVAGLGNILRQVDVNGTATPASKELEEAIPLLLARRAPGRRGVVGVWAVVYPSESAATGDIQGVLARGGHVRKVLSGGGGWGAKQGLLSLDPETRFTAAGAEGEEEDVESFIRSFYGEESGGGVVAPGGWVQFMVEEEEVGQELGRGGPRPAVMLGTHVAVDESDGSAAAAADGGVEVEVLEDVFGAASLKGIYVATEGEGGDGEIVTKIDAARSYVGAVSGSRE